jgi:hypothetical protein
VEGGQDHSSDRRCRRVEDLHHRVSTYEAITRDRTLADNVDAGTASRASLTPPATHNWRTSLAPRTRTTSSSRFWRRVTFRHPRYVLPLAKPMPQNANSCSRTPNARAPPTTAWVPGQATNLLASLPHGSDTIMHDGVYSFVARSGTRLLATRVEGLLLRCEATRIS